MKKGEYIIIGLCCIPFALHAEDRPDVLKYLNANEPSLTEIAKIQSGTNQEIEYMLDNYSLPQLAQYAVRVNRAQREAAKRAGTTLPPKLTREILQDREKIGQYLRSQYAFED